MNRQEVVRLYVNDHIAMRVIGRRYGVSEYTIRKILVQEGIDVRRRGPLAAELHPDWKGGVTIDKGGYVLLYLPGHPHAKDCRYVREHRLVMEKKLGRYLERWEVVHHIDGDRSNNNINNLELFETNGKHLAHELKGKVPNWTDDGVESMSRKPHSLPPDDQMIEMHKTKSASAIAKAIGCSPKRVRNVLRSLGVYVDWSKKAVGAGVSKPPVNQNGLQSRPE